MLPHQRQGFVRHAEAERRITRGEARHAQDAHRVFGEGFGHVAQQARFEVALPAVGIDDVAGVVLRHRVDGEIAPPQIVLELHVGRELGGEAAIPRRHLALQARERVFFLGLRMQEHRESRGPRE